MKKAVVTGGAGFIGSHLVRRLVSDGYTVSIIDDLSTGLKSNLAAVADKIEIVETSMLSPDAIRAFEGADIFYHLAAVISVAESIADPIGTHEINVTGFLRSLEAARKAGVRRVVLVSSAAIYGSEAAVPVNENAKLSPESPYGLHKIMAEQYGLLYKRLFGMEFVALRFFNVYGPGQRSDSPYTGVITSFLKRLSAGEKITIFGDGSNVRDFIHVDDVVEALVQAGTVDAANGMSLNIGTGNGTTINELAKLLSEKMNQPFAPLYQDAKEGDIKKSIADVSKAKEVLNWTAKVSLEEGIRTVSL